jgi:hypothetical protein
MSALYGLRYTEDEDDDDVDASWSSQVTRAATGTLPIFGVFAIDENEDEEESGWLTLVAQPQAVAASIITGVWIDDESEDEDDSGWLSAVVNAPNIKADVIGFNAFDDDDVEDELEQQIYVVPQTLALNDYVASTFDDAFDEDDEIVDQQFQILFEENKVVVYQKQGGDDVPREEYWEVRKPKPRRDAALDTVIRQAYDKAIGREVAKLVVDGVDYEADDEDVLLLMMG